MPDTTISNSDCKYFIHHIQPVIAAKQAVQLTAYIYGLLFWVEMNMHLCFTSYVQTGKKKERKKSGCILQQGNNLKHTAKSTEKLFKRNPRKARSFAETPLREGKKKKPKNFLMIFFPFFFYY